VNHTRHAALTLLIAALVLLAACAPPPSLSQPASQPPTIQPTLSLPTAPVPTPTAATTRSDADIAAEIDALLSKLVEAGFFSGDVLVARNGTVIFHKAYGLADREKQLPFTNQTRFDIGSLTKQFTAAAMMLLEQDGKLSVQDPICTHLPDCPDTWKPITIHHLLTHTAGLAQLAGSAYAEPVEPTDLQAAIARQPLISTPGAGFSYNNAGYVLAGRIVEEVSGKPYAQFLQERILGPTGMQNSGYADAGAQLAVGYRSASDEAAAYEPTVVLGALGVYSTAEDLLRWDQALYTDTPLTATSRARMFTGYTPADLKDAEYGYGWNIVNTPGRHLALHAGQVPGFETMLVRSVDDRSTIIILANQENAAPDVLWPKIASILSGTQ
jgi:CubicO group peptidase (beta-lactamase class C family)